MEIKRNQLKMVLWQRHDNENFYDIDNDDNMLHCIQFSLGDNEMETETSHFPLIP